MGLDEGIGFLIFDQMSVAKVISRRKKITKSRRHNDDDDFDDVKARRLPTSLLLHSNCEVTLQGVKTQKRSSLRSLQSERWSHTNVYGTCFTPLLHVKEGGSGVRGAGQETEVLESRAKHALCTSQAR